MALWPEGVTSINQVPNDLMNAIEHAFRILSWYENLPEDEQPPEYMWPFEEAISEWFDEVKAKREDKYGATDGGDDRETVPMMTNDFARGRGDE